MLAFYFILVGIFVDYVRYSWEGGRSVADLLYGQGTSMAPRTPPPHPLQQHLTPPPTPIPNPQAQQ